jgi:hypothetical protein
LRSLKLAILIVSGLFLLSNPVLALTINGSTYVGEIDPFYSPTSYGFIENSFDAEKAWIEEVTKGLYTLSEEAYDVTGDWTVTDQDPYAYAYEFGDPPPSLYFIKIGTGGVGGLIGDHFLYSNTGDSPLFAVVNALEWGMDWGPTTIPGNIDVLRISHLGEIGGTPVPEPTTIVLLGFGLLGLASVSRKKIKH